MQIYRGTYAKLARTAFVLGVLMLVTLAGKTTKADPLLFSNTRAFQNNNSTQVDLFSNPGTVLIGPNLSFRVDITGVLATGTVDTLRVSYNEAGSAPIVQIFQIPLFGTVPPPFTLFFSVVSPGANAQGLAATLTLDLLNSSPDFIIPASANQAEPVDSYTYRFNVAQPVPEPATLLAFGSGLVALASRRRRSL